MPPLGERSLLCRHLIQHRIHQQTARFSGLTSRSSRARFAASLMRYRVPHRAAATQAGLTPVLGRMKNFSKLLFQFKTLPDLLQLATLACILMGVMITLTPLMPGMTFGFDGTTLSWSELWQTHIAIALLVTGPLLILIGIGTLMARSWARPTLIFMPLIQVLPFYLVHWFLDAPSPIKSISISTYFWMCIVWAMIAYLYLYKSTAARKHFVNAA